MVIAGDRIEKGGKRLLQFCYCLLVDVDDEHIKKNMLEVSHLIEELRPVLNICNYVEIKREFLPAIVSSSIAYIIILVQCKL